MYFYRLLSLDELKQKKIHDNKNQFWLYENTHKYIKNKNYIHLFLNAESCFEDFSMKAHHKCYVAKFNIPDEIVCKYGIGLGGYSPTFNTYNKKYRTVDKSGHFWLPEIAIPEDDFSYDWCLDVNKAVDNEGKRYLKDDYITEDDYYREIVYDAYLFGFKNKDELLLKYRKMIELMKHIIYVLTTTKRINIAPKDLNDDSLSAAYSLVNYGINNGYLKDINEIGIVSSERVDFDAINIMEGSILDIVISKKTRVLNRSFCARLKTLGIEIIDNKDTYNIQIPKVKTKVL